MKPLHPASSPHRRGMPPSLLSHSSRSASPAAAEGDRDATVSEQPCVKLLDWWLATVEGDEQKIAVSGIFERTHTQILYELSPAPIAKRHSLNALESEDGALLLISGYLNKRRTLGYGYSNTVCEDFLVGFPLWWQSYKPCYPKPTNLDTACQPCSSNTTNENAGASSEAGKDIQTTPVVTLEVRGCHEETQHMALTEKAAVDEETPTSVYLDVQNSFFLSNGTPILEECDGDIPTNEDPAASNDDNERYAVPSKEVNNVEIGLIAGSTSSERGHDDIATNVSLAPTVECTNNAVSEAVDITPATGTYSKKTPVASLKSQGSRGQNQHIASNKKPVGRPKKQISAHEKRQSSARSQGTRSAVSSVLWSPLTRGKATSLSMSTPEALKLKRTRSGRVLVPKLDAGCQSIVYGRDGLIVGVIGLNSTSITKCLF